MTVVEKALQDAEFFSDDSTYVIVKLHPRAITVAAGIIAEIGEPFSALIVDKDEVSIMIVEDAITDFSNRLKDAEVGEVKYRLITIDVELPLDLIGFMARVSTALVDAGVSIMTYAAYTRDHFFVPVDQFDTALSTLRKLKSG